MNDNMMAVFLNGIAQLEYDRDKLMPDHQAAYLDKMDAKMDAGILLGGETIKNPDQNQRTQFAAANLASALHSADESMAAAMCSYLAIRLPELKQVKIDDNVRGADVFVIQTSFLLFCLLPSHLQLLSPPVIPPQL